MFSQLEFIEKVYPLHRTLVSDDTDKTLDIIGEHLPDSLKKGYSIAKIPSGKKCWTWTAPKKYVVNEAYVEDESGNKILNFNDNYLHLVSYSQPINIVLSYNELLPHLFYNKKRPGAIPWKFYYYKSDWGFCLPYNDFKKLYKTKKYKVVIDTEFIDDYLKIGELYIPGENKSELLITTNVCHPFQVNDSITGVSAVLEMLHQLNVSTLNKSLRVLFLPETIGSICYFASNLGIEKSIKHGLFAEMLGNNNSLVLQKSFEGNTYIDQAAEYVMKHELAEYRTAGFREMAGNDELVTNGPWLNIPTISLTRSHGAFKCYPEYHTSDDNPSMLIEDNLTEAADLMHKIVKLINSDFKPVRKFMGPVFLSGYGLWGVWGDLPNGKEYVDKIMYLMEGDLTVFEISKKIELDFYTTLRIVNAFWDKGLVERNYE